VRKTAARSGIVPVLACLAVGGCLPVPGGSEPTAGAQQPRVGQCHDTPDAVLADPHDPSPPVDCARPHTLETYAVLRPDGPLDARTLAEMDRRCVRRIDAFLGSGAFQQTAVSVYYFTPTRAEQADGARWVRCDAGVVADTGVATARRVTGSLDDAFAGGVPREYRRCLDSGPNPAAVQPLVPCSRPHVAEQLPPGVDLGDPAEPYAGTDRLVAEAQPRCAAAVQAEIPDAGRSLVVVPTARMWRAGTTTAQCWALAAPGERLNDSEAQPA
jgi:hypothetical protein